MWKSFKIFTSKLERKEGREKERGKNKREMEEATMLQKAKNPITVQVKPTEGMALKTIYKVAQTSRADL